MQPNWIFLVFARVLYQCFSFDKKKIISFNKKKKSRPESGDNSNEKYSENSTIYCNKVSADSTSAIYFCHSSNTN